MIISGGIQRCLRRSWRGFKGSAVIFDYNISGLPIGRPGKVRRPCTVKFLDFGLKIKWQAVSITYLVRQSKRRDMEVRRFGFTD